MYLALLSDKTAGKITTLSWVIYLWTWKKPAGIPCDEVLHWQSLNGPLDNSAETMAKEEVEFFYFSP